MRFFQEHELALIDTNAYVMGIWNHEKHETHEMAYTDVVFFQEHELALIDTNAYVMGVGKYERNRNKN